jgi:hypothetical protein
MTESVPPLLALVTAGSVLLLAVFVAVLTVLYLAGCRIWPYANCSRCKGTGRRIRFGRRLLDRHSNR